MMIELPDGRTRTWDGSQWPRRLLMCVDASFPYACGGGCPAEIHGHHALNVDAMAKLNDSTEELLCKAHHGALSGRELSLLPRRLIRLVARVRRHSQFRDGELLRDGYADLRAFLDYLGEIASLSPSCCGTTHGEDSLPNCSSSYVLHWDARPTKAAVVLARTITADIDRLQALSSWLK